MPKEGKHKQKQCAQGRQNCFRALAILSLVTHNNTNNNINHRTEDKAQFRVQIADLQKQHKILDHRVELAPPSQLAQQHSPTLNEHNINTGKIQDKNKMRTWTITSHPLLDNQLKINNPHTSGPKPKPHVSQPYPRRCH